jgi:hypothetical protein
MFIDRVQRMPELLDSIHPTGPGHLGYADTEPGICVPLDRILQRYPLSFPTYSGILMRAAYRAV